MLQLQLSDVRVTKSKPFISEKLTATSDRSGAIVQINFEGDKTISGIKCVATDCTHDRLTSCFRSLAESADAVVLAAVRTTLETQGFTVIERSAEN